MDFYFRNIIYSVQPCLEVINLVNSVLNDEVLGREVVLWSAVRRVQVNGVYVPEIRCFNMVVKSAQGLITLGNKRQKRRINIHKTKKHPSWF